MSKPACELPGVGSDTARLRAPAPATRVLRAENVVRSLFHVASGLVALGLIRWLPGRAWLVAVSGGIAASAWAVEVGRKRSAALNNLMMRLFAPVAHPHERHRVNSSTWYVTALLALALLAPQRAAELAVVVLAVGDPAAGFVGRRLGRTRLRAGRSLEGTLGFLVAGTLAALGVLAALHAGLPWPAMALLALTGGAAGALAELASTRVDDNFTVPVAVAAAVAAAGLALPGG